jgi:nucleoside-diphosphate-sugar epimerase
MRILLIGGTGFIGPHVARLLLAQGHEVLVFHRGPSARLPGAGEILGDRRRLMDSADALRASRSDVVVDLILSSGAQAHDLMTALRGAAARVVALSSCDVYRACGVLHGLESGPLEPLPLVETSPLRTARQAYPRERLQALQQVFGWLDEEYDKIPVEGEVLGDPRLPGTVLRLPMVYGPGDPLHRLFPLVKRMGDERSVILMEDKHAAWRAPRGYVENVAAAIALAAIDERAAGRVYNVADPDNLSELDWAREVAAVTGWRGGFGTLPADSTPPHLRMPGNLDQHWTVDSTRIRDELGYREPLPRREAIRRTVEWERANPPAVDSRQFDYAAEDAVLKEGSHGRAVRWIPA